MRSGGRRLWQRGRDACRAPPPTPFDAVVRFGRTASIEVETVCELPAPVARAELWRLAVGVADAGRCGC